MQFNRNEFVTALALALDFLEASLRKNITNHNKRVALMAIGLGEQVGLSPEELFDLYAYSMLHDNGISHLVYNKMASGQLTNMETSQIHCLQGEANMKPFPFLRPRTGIIQYHHENYDGSGYFGLQGGDIPLLSQIIHVADRVEILYSTGHDRFDVARQVVDWKGTWFSPELYEAFAELSAPMSFWLSLDNLFIETELSHRMPIYSMYLTLQELLPIAGIISKIIDEKSPFTGMHSQGIAEKSGIMADFYQFDEDRKIKLVLAAHLHDVGKLVVPNAILDKPGRLTSAEFEVIKVHTFYTRQVLERITGLEDVAEWASNHHEKLDGTGYPYGISKNRLSFESQLLACIDIYQALTEERPYHAPLDRETVRKIMFEMADNNSINRDIVADVLETQC